MLSVSLHVQRLNKFPLACIRGVLQRLQFGDNGIINGSGIPHAFQCLVCHAEENKRIGRLHTLQNRLYLLSVSLHVQHLNKFPLACIRGVLQRLQSGDNGVINGSGIPHAFQCLICHTEENKRIDRFNILHQRYFAFIIDLGIYLSFQIFQEIPLVHIPVAFQISQISQFGGIYAFTRQRVQSLAGDFEKDVISGRFNAFQYLLLLIAIKAGAELGFHILYEIPFALIAVAFQANQLISHRSDVASQFIKPLIRQLEYDTFTCRLDML